MAPRPSSRERSRPLALRLVNNYQRQTRSRQRVAANAQPPTRSRQRAVANAQPLTSGGKRATVNERPMTGGRQRSAASAQSTANGNKQVPASKQRTRSRIASLSTARARSSAFALAGARSPLQLRRGRRTAARPSNGGAPFTRAHIVRACATRRPSLGGHGLIFRLLACADFNTRYVYARVHTAILSLPRLLCACMRDTRSKRRLCAAYSQKSSATFFMRA